MSRPLLNPATIRLDPQINSALKRVAKKHGVKPSVLIRDALYARVPEWERHGVILTKHPEQEASR